MARIKASPRELSLTNTIASIVNHHGRDDPRLDELRTERATEQLAEHIRQVVATAPPLSPEQRERLSLLLHPGCGVRDAS